MNRKLLAFIVGSLLVFAGRAQVANFTAQPSSGCSPLPVIFTNTSTGATSYQWDFGDGTNSTAQNPSVHLYSTPGTYNVTLTINGNGTLIKTVQVIVNSSPTANFTVNNQSGCFPLKTQFSDISTPGSGTITTWSWDFGDGDTSNLQNPSHTYTAAANFPVTLKVTTSAGCSNTLTNPGFIKIGSGVTADFTSSSSAGCSTPIAVNFSNSSTGPPTLTYSWDFGDGGTSTQQNPLYNYASAGTYNIKLITTSSAGCIDTIIKPTQIAVGGSNVSSFNSPDSACSNSNITFTNTSSPVPTVSSWDFGDGTTSTQISPVKSYTTSGIYTVKLTNTFGTCVVTTSKPITIINQSLVSFSAASTASCNVPFTVSFTDQSSNALGWLWDFGDGTTSTSQNPSHTYTTFGLYNVALAVTGTGACGGFAQVNNYIQIVKPYLKLTNLPGFGCVPYSYTPAFEDSAVSGTITSYSWDFGDGTTSNVANPPAHSYAVAGKYAVKLTITTSAGCSALAVDTVKVGTQKPVPAFTASPTTVCASAPVQFMDQSTGSPDQWLWNFGDGGLSGSQNPTHTYTNTGIFPVKLIVYNSGCPDSLTKNAYITVNPPIAKFKYTFSCASATYTYTFVDQSIGADSWSWDFGDGTTSTLQNPAPHTFAGNLTSATVRLTVKNNSTGCSSVSTQTIQLVSETISFVNNLGGVCQNVQTVVQISVSDVSKISAFKYDFGDGTTSSAYTISPPHTYTALGTYTVTVTVTDINGCQTTISKPLYNVYGPKAQFSTGTAQSCLPFTATFNDQSTTDGTNNIVSWIWDFGDGNVQTFSAPPFTHFYAAQGIYNVKLKVVDAFGCADSIAKTNFITVTNPKAVFSAVDSLSCPGSPVQFVNNSTGYGLTYSWDFGDGGTSANVSPSHGYAVSGMYTVTLTVKDQFGCTDVATRNNFITINIPVASFTVDNTVASCPPLKANFTFTGSYYQTLKWLFGDGGTSSLLNPTHFYTIPGVYYDTLIVYSHGGCTDTATPVKIQVFGPYGAFTYSPLTACHNLTVNFNVVTSNVVKYIWDFNNGQTQTTTVSNTTYSYDTAGKYVPLVILQDATGCSVPVFGTDTIVVVGSKVNFGYDKTVMCQSGTVQFSDSTITSGIITNYDWDFGDGNTSTAQNPSHTYTTTGLYTVKLVVTAQAGCKDSLVQNALIKVVANPTVDINGANSVCVPTTLTFQGVEVVTDTSVLKWSWNFFNGQTSAVQNPPAQTYTVAGSNSVELIATNSSGCADTVTKNFTIYPLPLTNAGNDTTICLGQSAQLNATGASTYNWLPPNTTLSCTNCASPLATPNAQTSYVVIGSTTFGCTTNDTVVVKVVQPKSLNVSPSLDTICIGQSVSLIASGEDLYTWTPSAGLSNPNIANPVATPDTSTLYQVTGTDSLSCFSNTQNVDIVVYNYPTVNLGPDIKLPVGNTYQIPGTGSPDIVSIVWTPTTALSCTVCLTPVASPVNTTEYIVKVENIAGCATSDSLNIIVTCNNLNLFVPNTFSPNGDGMNDVFYVRGKGLATVQSMRIFDRWGQMIFEKRNFAPNDPSVGWDGTFNGKKMPIDVYIYTIEVICENSVVVPYHGNVALIR